MEFTTIEQILNRENEMAITAQARYGKYYETALQCSLFMTHFLKFIGVDRWVFASFLSQVKKHHTLALFSVVRLHQIQAMMNLRQALEAGTCAAFAIAHTDHSHFVDTDEYGILDAPQSLAGKRYKWLEENFPNNSNLIKEIKKQINAATAHSNLIYAHNNFQMDEEHNRISTPFFDTEDEHHVKTYLWSLGNVAIILMDLFHKVNETRNVIVFADDFLPRFNALAKKNNALKAEMTSSDRYKQAVEKEKLHKGK